MAPSLNCRWRLGLIQTGAVTDGAEVASCSQLICARLIDAHIRLVQPVTGRRTVILLLLQPASKPQNHTARGEAMSYQLRFAKGPHRAVACLTSWTIEEGREDNPLVSPEPCRAQQS
ncbi:hypothetical protein PGTUg99_007466 [Puccinia graminis f. sp. tritici]|uniref:Uncharacterized protein n=1 Tax=Puccinia graminis f. sp. tritici TaxID=56615 RepID=A0A5B0S3N1_PUCGR|nr:hypothetical protein PGTUg99_007466 [Puccinia graminis f. sp. tritici]